VHVSVKLSAYLNAINSSKTPMSELDDDFYTVKKKYVPFVVNRCLSFFPDTIIQSNNMNLNPHLDKEMQYEYLLHSIRPRKRFSPWQKKGEHKDLDLIKEYFGYSNTKAYEILDLLTDEDLEHMREEMSVGG
jgi:hypothetical protein